MIKLVGLTGGIGSGKSTVAQIIHDGNVRLAFKRPWSDGTSSVELEPLALIARLAALVPSHTSPDRRRGFHTASPWLEIGS